MWQKLTFPAGFCFIISLFVPASNRAASPAPSQSTTAPLVVLWDTAHCGTNPTTASHSLLRGDQAAATFILKTSGEVTSADLAAVHLYVLVEPDARNLTASEITAIRGFMARGGGFLLFSDSDADAAGVNAVLKGSGLALGGNYTGGFVSTSDITSHPTTAKVLSLFVASGGTTFAVAAPAVSCIRYNGKTIVAAADLGSNRVAVVGDETSFQNAGAPTPYYLRDDNRTLAGNLFNWFRRPGFRGQIALDAGVYAASATATVMLSDNDLLAATSATVEARSNLGDREWVVLSQIGPGQFRGQCTLRPVPVAVGDRLLAVADGSTVTIVYHDATTSTGLPADSEARAAVDGRPPAIGNVAVRRIGPFSARVEWITDEPAHARVRFGLSRAATTQSVQRADFRSSHSLELRWLQPETTYWFTAESSDRVGNLAAADGGTTGFSFTTGSSRRASPLLRVLLLYSDVTILGATDIRAKLLADGRIGEVSLWDYALGLPTLDILRAYDAVLLHVNYAASNRTALGDRLADYIEWGGPVVSLNLATVGPPAVLGRFASNHYGLLAHAATYASGTAATLGTRHLADHPLLDDVERFHGGVWSGHQSPATLTSGVLCVADWSDGEPLAAYRIAGATRLAALNFFGPSSDASPELWDAATDGARLMANALVWVSRALESDGWTTPGLLAEPAFTRGTTNSIAWSDLPNAELVQLEWSEDGFASDVRASEWLPLSPRQYLVEGLADGATYSYRLRGRNSALGYSPYSNVVRSRQDASPPDSHVAPLPAYQTSPAFPIAWTGDDGGSGLASVRLYYRRGTNGAFLPWGDTFTVSPIAFNAAQTGGDGEYLFFTRAMDVVGNVEAEPITPDAHTTVITVPPAAPNFLPEPPVTSGTTNRLTWGAVSGAATYYLEWSASSSFSPIAGNSGWIGSTSYWVSGLSDSLTYHYRVRSRNAALLHSAWSAPVHSRQDASPPQTNVLALSAYQTSPTFAVAWTGSDAVSGLAFVRLYYRRGTSGGFVQYGGNHAASPILFNSAQTGGDGDYFFYTRGTDTVGNVENAPVAADAQTTVLTVLPDAPVLVTEPLYTSGTSNRVEWNGVAGAAAYYLEWSRSSSFLPIAGNSGWTTATAHRATGLSDGTTYYYRAKCRNAALRESVWSNVVSSLQDSQPPQSRVLALPAVTMGATFTIQCQASDTASGVREVRLHYRRGVSGVWREWPLRFESNTLRFDVHRAEGYGFYQFYSCAWDNVNYQEAVPPAADAQTTVAARSTGSTSSLHWPAYR